MASNQPPQKNLSDELTKQTKHLHELQQLAASGFYEQWAKQIQDVEDQTRKLQSQLI